MTVREHYTARYGTHKWLSRVNPENLASELFSRAAYAAARDFTVRNDAGSAGARSLSTEDMLDDADHDAPATEESDPSPDFAGGWLRIA